MSSPCDKGEHSRVLDKAHEVADGQNEEEQDIEKNDGDSNAITSDCLSPCDNEEGHQEREAVAENGRCIGVNKSGDDAIVANTSARPSLPLGAQGLHQEGDAEINNIVEEQQGGQGVHSITRDSVETVVDNDPEVRQVTPIP
jgi:hypothetical protein